MAKKTVKTGTNMRSKVLIHKRVPNSLGDSGKEFHKAFHKGEAMKHRGLAEAHTNVANAAAQSGDYKMAWHNQKLAKVHNKAAAFHEGMVGENDNVQG